ncbi:uncharacterized protein LOC133805043 isoform X5 [Humulus lupulus]|uniref:uncharacterized protein LOC133805043 isoform X5 n=1 Tax=Humulus lupulus TaxID=3486 RepID=UPI002B412053|nr:uncharacterized protein LOC133805043 isoform X5 [Humulus lupulus]XP_062099245.1 uncharacterized protein LOC133805043 isoform X5 [Humulus lupulus]XP_062099253.1 uncharacterized protein LOC133805043 isoform X5 [Humulus lupulus]XP_062099262.1 uncharacterized protein LOC133805043 isoform X5 [Humulus lupulus]XP_062099270.1 uncharacterized protein LOC133805043 isoform X5 [Humulus lupulus]XP_062099276.1 uncharacterized protein LOC133805043 isoform X5 [Humulus lupulus]
MRRLQRDQAKANLLITSTIAPISLFLLLLTLFSQTHFSSSFKVLILNSDHPFTPVLSSISDVHDLLPKFSLPKGLLPNFQSYSLSGDDSFEVELKSPYYVYFDRYVYYDKKIIRKLSYGSVSNVTGIEAKMLLLWVSVTKIHTGKGSDSIRFYVGSLFEDLPASKFENVPDCKSKACKSTNPESI